MPTAVLYRGVAGDGVNGDGVNGEAGYLYFSTLGPWIFAVNSSTGAVLWRSTTPADDFFSAPLLWHGLVLAGNYDNHLYA